MKLDINLRLFWILFCIIVVVTVVTRLSSVDTSLGHDAVASLQETSRAGVHSVWDYISLRNLLEIDEVGRNRISHELELAMPGFFVLNKAWIWTFGNDLSSIRLFPSILSMLVVVAGGIFGRKIFGNAGALILVVMLATSPLIQYYGSYIRFYALLVILSTIAYLMSWKLVNDIEEMQFPKNSTLVVFLVLCWFIPFVHVTGLLSIFIILLPVLTNSFFKLPKPKKIILIAGIIIPAIVILGNAVAYVIARFTTSGAVMSSSTASFLASLLFNFNGLIFFGILFCCLVRVIDKRSLLLWYIPFGFALFCIFLMSIFAPSFFRPDYMSSLLGPMYVLFTHSVICLTRTLLSKTNHISAKLLPVLLVTCTIAFTFPSFVSNAFIDQDKWDYHRALLDIRKDAGESKVILFAFSALSYPEDKSLDIQIEQIGKRKTFDFSALPAGTKVYFALRWQRQGFRKDFRTGDLSESENREIFKSSDFIGISGANRLDLRDNLIFIYKKR